MHNTLLLYVTDPGASARFYATLLDQTPVEQSPTFALFILPSGLGLGLWARDGVVPAPPATNSLGGGCEIGFKVADAATVDATHTAWAAHGAPIALPPTTLDFGHSFLALDPDGHRLRVYAMAEAG